MGSVRLAALADARLGRAPLIAASARRLVRKCLELFEIAHGSTSGQRSPFSFAAGTFRNAVPARWPRRRSVRLYVLVLCTVARCTARTCRRPRRGARPFHRRRLQRNRGRHNAVAESGDPRAATIIEALQDGRLLYSAEQKKVFYKDADGKLFDAATGAAVAGAGAGRSRHRRHQQPAAARHRCGARRPDADVARSGQAARRRPGGVQVPRGNVLPARRGRHRQGNQSPHQAGADRRPAPPSSSIRTTRAKRTSIAAVDGDPRARRPGRGRNAVRASRRYAARRSSSAAAKAPRRHVERACAVGHGAERLVRALARLGAAARRDRPCHHFRRHGRHQHGPWRDGDARRLCDLRDPGSGAQLLSRPARIFAGHRRAACLHRLRARSAS